MHRSRKKGAKGGGDEWGIHASSGDKKSMYQLPATTFIAFTSVIIYK